MINCLESKISVFDFVTFPLTKRWLLFVCLAIAVLWIEFVREIRWCWEESQPLPKIPTNGSIDLATCLINQKLQMVIKSSNHCWTAFEVSSEVS